MKLLVCPHELKIGGSQMNAIDLAATLRDRGHEVTLFSTPGPMADYINRLGLRLVTAQPKGRRPSMSVIRQLRELVQKEQFDLVHTFERNLALEAYFGAHVLLDVPVVATIMTMWLSRLPRSIPLTMGTEELVEDARRKRGGEVSLFEPPVNTDVDHPDVDPSPFVAEHDLDDGRLNMVMITRLDPDLKLEGVNYALAATERLCGDLSVRLVLVGGGRGASEIERKANEINERAGRRCVVLTGPTLDPRSAYAAADIVLGQGGSSLRGMAYAKPVIVIGQEGYSEIVAPGSIDRFQRVGFHGIGFDGGATPDPARMHALASGPPHLNDDDPGIERLAALMCSLVEDPIKRQKLGAFGRDVICSRFSLERAATKMEMLYKNVLLRPTARRVTLAEGGSTMSWVLSATLKAQMLKRARRVVGGR